MFFLKEDPLFAIKNETNEEKKKEKDEENDLIIQRSENAIKDFEEYEDVYDTPDEFHPDESNTDEDYEEEVVSGSTSFLILYILNNCLRFVTILKITRKSRSKRKKNIKDGTKSNDSELDDDEVNQMFSFFFNNI